MNRALSPATVLADRMEELGLGFMAASLESFLSEQAGKSQTLTESLSALLDIEYRARKERTARTRLKLSGMPQTKVFEDFDLSWLKGGMTRERFEALRSLSFIERKENVLFLGPSGVGKTHTLAGNRAKSLVSGYTAYYMTCYEAIDSLIRAREQGGSENVLAGLESRMCFCSTKWATNRLPPNRRMSSFS
jgi:DNA replication protein DnaC